MKKVCESLNQFNDNKFFSVLLEENKITPDEKKKLAADMEKQGMAVIKKIQANFKRFKTIAGDKMQSYRDFWAEQKTADETIGQEGNFYNLYDSHYIVGVVKNKEGIAELKVYNTDVKDNDEFETFVCKDKNVLKSFKAFFDNDLKATMLEIISNHKAAIEAKKAADKARIKEADAAKKKAKLDAFLGESKKFKKKLKINENENLSGKRIKCIHCVDEYSPIEDGAEGTINMVDDMGTIHVKWDDGRTLGLVPDEDEYEIL